MSSEEEAKYERIPQPPTHALGFLGNIPDVDSSFALKSFWKLATLYGPIVQLDLVSRKAILLSNYDLIHEVCNDDRFEKVIGGALKEVRAVVGDGLFTAYPHEPNWHKAHRTLMPVFGPMGVRKMFPEMADIASQMILRWDRLGPNHIIDTADDFTRLAFDTIGICAFNYRFNNFYSERMHPFADQMAESLVEAGKRAGRLGIETSLRIWSTAHLQDNIQKMHKLCDDIIAERKAHPKPEVNDLLNVMLNIADPVTGEKLDDENIRFQMATFLIAGHETTSGTLAYLFYNLLKNPEKMHKAQQEVDSIVGDNTVEVKHLNQLKYIDACIKETLRLNGPIGAIGRHAKHDTVIGGKYKIPADTGLVLNLKGLHQDPKIWGEDAAAFKPERMLDFDKLPPDAWKPFGTGVRACIGRAFAEQEMILNVALILQRFQVEMADPSYELAIKSTLTTKPEGFSIKVRRRAGKDVMVGLGSKPSTASAVSKTGHPAKVTPGAKSKITVAYGSNAGTCKTFAEDLQTNAPEYGFEAEVAALDSMTEAMVKGKPTVIITSSYEGKPPDNAKKFVSWLETNAATSDLLKETSYALFGVGNSEWASTYHKVPKTIESLLQQHGSKQIIPSAFADVKSDCTGEWEQWSDKFWQTLESSGLAGAHEQKSELNAQVYKHDVPSMLGGQEMSWGIVKSARSLGGQEVGPEKRELEVQLPEGVTYQTGDYLVVLPLNHADTVKRVLARFNLHADDLIQISGTRKAFLASKEPIPAAVFFTHRVELGLPPTQRQLELLASFTEDKAEHDSLISLAGDESFKATVLGLNYAVLDILEDHPSCAVPLSAFIDILKPLTPRQYSISSSPLAPHAHVGQDTYTATISYDTHTAPARSSQALPTSKPRTFHGVASSYLSRLIPGQRIHCFVRKTNAAFHLPEDPSVPIIMIAAGTGIAPMRGFIQERAAIESAGARKMGRGLLYFGCRDFEKDYIYCDEFAEYEKTDALQVRPAFSKRAPTSETERYKYTHERMWADRKELSQLFGQGAKVFLCGSASKLAKSTAEVVKKIYADAARERGVEKSEQEVQEWFERIREVRYVSDVFE